MDQHDAGPQTSPPGKRRTWWHPLFVQLLRWRLGNAYDVLDEVSVGTMPLRADIVLIRREQGDLSETARRELAALVQHLNRWTLVEFKSPADVLQQGDLDQLFGVAHLFCSQQSEPIDSADLSLIVLAASLTQPFLDDLRRRHWSIEQHGAGIHVIRSPAFTTWIIETDQVTGPEEPILTLFSRVFLRERRRIMEELSASGHEAVLHYVMQQVQQFRVLGEGFAMQHTDTQEMDRLVQEYRQKFWELLTPEERLEGLSADERLEGLSADEILRGLDEQQRERLRLLLEQRPTDQSAD
ncbi:MAG: hypothetical protein ACREJB_09070 [Planctomycetaceae bacterium]